MLMNRRGFFRCLLHAAAVGFAARVCPGALEAPAVVQREASDATSIWIVEWGLDTVHVFDGWPEASLRDTLLREARGE